MQRIGLFGGTFDPVHDGHLQLAQAARIELQLEKVLLIPAADPPHKSIVEVTPFLHRREMLRLALEGVDGLELCLIEENLPTPSYTIDTVRHLQANDNGNTDLCFIIGADAFVDMMSWKSYRELLQRVTIAVASRKGFRHGQRMIEISDALGYVREGRTWLHGRGLKDIVFMKDSPAEVSSSRIRELLKVGCAEIVGLNDKVLQYIQRHRLYR
jgi:nicotinate-nucleotide adenylyltransferase